LRFSNGVGYAGSLDYKGEGSIFLEIWRLWKYPQSLGIYLPSCRPKGRSLSQNRGRNSELCRTFFGKSRCFL